VTSSFTAVGAGSELQVRTGQSFTYSVSGTFVGTVALEQQDRGRGAWRALLTATAAASGTLVAEEPGKAFARLRWRCTAYTSGTIDTTIADVLTDVDPRGEVRSDDRALLTRTTEAGIEVFDQRDSASAASLVRAVEVTFTEAGAGTYTGSVVLPAGATLLDILVNGVVLWAAGTSATMKVGDGADDDGFYTGVDLKATDLLAGESISFALAGGQAGAYIANSQVSPRYSASARTISGVVTSVGAGTDGRTRMVVVYVAPINADIRAAA
jgi:hypothetical protein